MCEEILTTGEVLVKRPDAPFLISIRDGAWTFEKLVSWAEEKEKELDQLYQTSSLKHSADVTKVNDLCVSIVKEAEKDGFPT
jgi:hypothetical protein